MSSGNLLSAALPDKTGQEAFEWKWNAWGTVTGALAWTICLTASLLGKMCLGPTEYLFLLAPLVTIPLGLRVVLGGGEQRTAPILLRITLILQPVGALMAAVGLALPPGPWAGTLAAVWLTVTVCIGLCGLKGLWGGGIPPLLERACQNLGLIYLPFGGVWLLASRLGLSPAGFKEPIVFLTAVHFHYAAFAAPILAGMTGAALRRVTGSRHRLFPVAALSVMAAPALLAAGWALGSPFLKVVAAFVLAGGLMVLVALTLIVIPNFRSQVAGTLLVLSGLSVIAGMCLVCVYAGGEFAGTKLITIPQMAVSHGILNSLGFTLCGLLAWPLERNATFAARMKSQVIGGRQ